MKEIIKQIHLPAYDAANRFYLVLGEVLPTLWDECNPCQIHVMSL